MFTILALYKNMENQLKKIRKFFKIHRRLPTYQELANLFNFASKNAAYKLAQKLILDHVRIINGNLGWKPEVPVIGVPSPNIYLFLQDTLERRKQR